MCSPNLALVKIEQAVAMAGLFVGHPGEELGGGGIVGAELFREIAVDAAVFFLGRDGEREKLGFIQVAEMHGDIQSGWDSPGQSSSSARFRARG